MNSLPITSAPKPVIGQESKPIVNEEIEIELEPFVSKCVKPPSQKLSSNRAQRNLQLNTRKNWYDLYYEYNDCKKREVKEKEEWDRNQQEMADRKRQKSGADRNMSRGYDERQNGGVPSPSLNNIEKFTDYSFPTSDAIYWNDYKFERESSVA